MTRDISASVRGRLENAARESGRPLQELMQYFVIERFLFRLSKSKHAERFVLKGALMFRVWGTPQSRATRDIDLLARVENSVQTISAIMKDVCQQSVEPDGVEFPSDSVRGTMIKEDAEYSGVRVTFVAMIQNARLPMQIDVGFGDVIHPVATTITYPTMLDFDAPNLIGYPKETVIAEKFEAMVKLGQLNSRMKDFFDVCVLACQFDFDAEILSNAVQKTFANRGTELLAEPYVFAEPFRLDATKQIQWTAFIRKSKLEGTWDSFSNVVDDISIFLSPIAQSLAAGRKLIASWKAGGPWGH